MNLKQQRFITEMLRHGDKVVAYKIAYQSDSASYTTLESAANRLLKNPEVAAAIQSTVDRIRHEVEEELKAEMRRELLSVQRKREILARIAEGDVYIEQTFKGKGCQTCTQMAKPTINQMLKAIDIDNRMAGDYKDKRAVTFVHTNVPVPQIPPQEAEVTDEIIEEEGAPVVISHAGLRRLLRYAPRQTVVLQKETSAENHNKTQQTET